MPCNAGRNGCVKSHKTTSMLNIDRQTKTLLYFSIFSASLVIARVVYTDKLTYLFLIWNLLLAAIPYILIRSLSVKSPSSFGKLINAGIIVTWVLFFPNAPYIFTDLFHLRYTSSSIIWYDTTLILSTTWTGLLFGYLSLIRIERHILKFVPRFWSRIMVYAMLFLSAFGVYIGRYLRFNSWDIVSNPFELLAVIGNHVFDPFTHPRTWGMTIVFGLFLCLIYSSLSLFQPKNLNRTS